MSRTRPDSRCYICGALLVDVPRHFQGELPPNARTRDHVPPQGVFLDPKPRNPIKVDCCYECNNKHSDFDDQLRALAAMSLGRNAAGQRILEQKVFGSTLAKRRQSHFFSALVQSMRNTSLEGPGGVLEMTEFSVAARPLEDGAINITKGLLREFYPQANYWSSRFWALTLNLSTLNREQRAPEIASIARLLQTTEDSRGNHDEFRFWREVKESPRLKGAWLLVFYDSTAFVVTHTQVDC